MQERKRLQFSIYILWEPTKYESKSETISEICTDSLKICGHEAQWDDIFLTFSLRQAGRKVNLIVGRFSAWFLRQSNLAAYSFLPYSAPLNKRADKRDLEKPPLGRNASIFRFGSLGAEKWRCYYSWWVLMMIRKFLNVLYSCFNFGLPAMVPFVDWNSLFCQLDPNIQV